MAKLRVAINGFGRIGRIVFREMWDKVDFVAVNTLGDPATLAHLVKYDSTHGVYHRDISFDDKSLIVDGQRVPMSFERDPSNVDWKSHEVDIVFECSGAFKKKEDFLKHIHGGAKRVIVSAPAPEADLTVVYGINHNQYDPASHAIVSNASCTTNCLAPVAKVIHESFGIEHATMTTIHSYTNDQRVLDNPHKDRRRARTAATSMIPTTTGAAKAVGMVLPDLDGKIDGLAVRVPTPNVSLVDFNFTTSQELSVDAINSNLSEASQSTLKGVLAVEKTPLVSVDFNGHPASSIVDLPSTMVVGPKMGKVLSWYDNEVGFSHRMVDLANYMAEKGL